jgi:hypothetical protein
LLASRTPEGATLPGDWRYPDGGPAGGQFQREAGVENTGQPDLGDERFVVYPNPAARDNVNIRFLLDSEERAELRFFDVSGSPLPNPVLTPGPEAYHAGDNVVRWDIRDVSPGMYLCRLERRGPAGTRVETARIVVAR